MKTLWLSAFALGLLGCADWTSGDVYEAGPELDSTAFEVVAGTVTAARPEVGLFNHSSNAYCTATLITPRHFVTAAHCIAKEPIRESRGTFTIGTNTYQVARVTSLGVPAGFNDVALGRLTTDVPANVATPATLAVVQPARGTLVTGMGYGCSERPTESGGGTRRYGEFTWGEKSTRLCYGDSGGPIFAGGLGARGPIVGIFQGHYEPRNDPTQADVFSDPTIFKQRIEQTILDWEGNLEEGINRPGLDFDHFAAAHAPACRSACGAHAACRAFSYDARSGLCWLKNGVPEAVPTAGVTSGRPPAVGLYDRRGYDYANFLTTFNGCRQTCFADYGCLGFTYITTEGRCWLKNYLNTGSACSNCLTSVKRGIESGVNRPGGDYLTIQAGSARACAERCSQEDRCVAFSYVESDYTCWLKSHVPPAQSAPSVHSGVRRGWEINVDRQGQDIDNFVVDAPRPELCQAACNRNSACKAWTLVTSPVAGENRCWLKNGVPATRANAYGMISGLRGADFF